MTTPEELIIEKIGTICTLTINNPTRRNALKPQCLEALVRAFEDLKNDKQIRVVVLRGSGEEAFSAGADITTLPSKDASLSERRAADPSAASNAIVYYPFPVISMLHGYTLGAGCALAMACDIRIASTTVKMGIPTSRMGLLSSYQGFKRFIAVLGYSTALEMFLTGRMYDSSDCLQMGMVNHLLEPDQVESYTYRMAEEIGRCAPLAVQGSKYVMNWIARNPEPAPGDIERFDALRMEAANSIDHEEARAAFMEKRPPVFTGS